MAMTYFGAEEIFDQTVEMNQVANQPVRAFHSSVPRGTADKEEVFHVEHSVTILWHRGVEL